MYSARYQRGMTLTGLIMGCIALGGAALVGMKLWPVYNEKMKVDMAMDKLAGAPEGARMTTRGMAKLLQKQFDVNDVDSIDERRLPKLLKVERLKGKGKEVTLAYEIRSEFFSNLDIVMNYNKSVQLGEPTSD